MVDRDIGHAKKMFLVDCRYVAEIHKVMPLLLMPHFILAKSGPQVFSSFISYSLKHNRHTSFFSVPVLLILDPCEDG